MNATAARRRKLIRSLKEHDLAGLFITDPVNVSYLTGFTGDSSYLIVTPKKTVLVSDTRFEIQIREECPDLETNIRGYTKTTLAAAVETIGKLRISNLGIEGSHLTVNAFEKLRGELKAVELAPTAGIVEELRAIKDAGEIEAIRRSVRMAERAFGMFRAMLEAGKTEKELADDMEFYLRKAGAAGSAFPVIAAVGERSALPHCPPTDLCVAEADFLLVDWGAMGPQYQSDLTRVIPAPFEGDSASLRRRRKVESELRMIYTVVLQAQERAIAQIGPGVSVKEVDAAARGFIADAGYGEFFNHGLGHGIGLKTHEMPDIRSTSDHVLQAGMVVTVEPGIYLEGFGGVRIEDDVLVTPDGREVLSTLPKRWEAVWE